MKKKAKVLAVAASVLAMAGVANAANIDINIYGASAQYLYWNDVADNFLIAKGCSGVTQAQSADKKHGITTGNNCSEFGGNNVTIRYSSKASYESVRSLNGTTNPDSCPDAHQRKMAGTVAAPGTLVCKDITLGASDVAGESFVQESHGQKFGPLGGGNVDIALSGEDASNLTASNPLVVPFGFFVNKAVTAKKCAPTAAAPNTVVANQGEFCMDDRDCGLTTATSNICQSKTIDNITRLQAVNIFSGGASNWSDFGAFYTPQPIVACLRHAGSGTHASLDLAVVKGNGWGASVTSYEDAGRIWFNEGSTDLMKCVNGITSSTQTAGTAIGAIGYADADQAVGVAGISDQVAPVLKYNGVTPSRSALRNGLYDFWSTQWVYENADRTTADQRPVVDAIVAYAADPANIPSTKTKYWATKDEMKFFKFSDSEYISFQGAAANPQTP